MAKFDLDAHLEANPKAARHADSIRETLKSLETLRDQGLSQKGYSLASPFGGRAAMPSRKDKPPLRRGLKLTF